MQSIMDSLETPITLNQDTERRRTEQKHNHRKLKGSTTYISPKK